MKLTIGRAQREYYDRIPTPDFRTGDIWSDLPTHGLLPRPHASGLVITPACDLANRKVDTITYLPILPIRLWLCSPFHVPTLLKSAAKEVAKLHKSGYGPFPDPSADLSELDSMIAALSAVSSFKSPDTDRILFSRTLKYLASCRSILSGQTVALPDLTPGTAEERRSLFLGIVRNSYRTDLHFLPADGESPDTAAVPEHSVVLFRCPLTAPIQVLDLANDIAHRDWSAAMQTIGHAFPISKAFAPLRPVRRGRLKERFASDLITRYTSLYVRLGSPDFTDETQHALATELMELA